MHKMYSKAVLDPSKGLLDARDMRWRKVPRGVLAEIGRGIYEIAEQIEQDKRARLRRSPFVPERRLTY